MLKVKRKFTRILFLIVSLFGLASTAMLLNDPPPSEFAYANSEYSESLFTMNSLAAQSSRNPASIVPVKSEALFELSCADDMQVFETGRTRFRLKGDNCNASNAPLLSTQILNQSNGYVATIFHKTQTTFTTDYINLNVGENKIKVLFETASGPSEKIVTVVRSAGPPSKK